MKLTIKKLQDSVWQIFGFQHAEAVADRDNYRTKIEKRLGSETASQIERHVDAALGRSQIDADPDIMTMRQFYELLALEQTIDEVRQRIDANAVFIDTDGLLSTKDILPHLDDHGLMPVKNVIKFLAMVRMAEDETEGRRQLVEFLGKAIKMGEPIRCEL
jgi:hypothetical protein